jgi:hypothetical protein
MIYKTLKKVSEYCQLLDKSKYRATQTINGVTFTNNGDGTITANGTATSRAVLVLFNKTLPIIRWKGLIIGDPQPGYAFINYMLYNNENKWIVDNASYHGNGVIFTGKDDAAYAILYIAIEQGSTANNLIFKPQLFDLTEMYGAGHEPTTVEQFRQDFPDEMYDYKPYCFVKSYKTLLKVSDDKIITSYKKSLFCKTKNLWTCDKTMVHAIYSSGTQVFKVIKTGSGSCYTLPTPMPPGTAVTVTVHCLSGYTKNVVTIGGYHNETGNTSWQCNCNLPMNIDLSGKSFSQTVITTNTLTDFWIFVYGLVPNNLQFKVQLELGDTATDYVPYGHL